jgi:hypothetical protein
VSDVADVFEQLVPANAEFGDWDDVLRRAGVGFAAPPAPKPRRRPRLLLAAALLLLVIPAAIVAAVVTRTDVLFSSSKPAPNIVKKRFLDLGFGAPPRFALAPLASKAREVGTFRFGGHAHKLWVAPTRHGGYCFMVERAFGGCIGKRADRPRFSVGFRSDEPWRPTAVTRIDGQINDQKAARVELRYADGSTSDVSFFYVSAPIDAGFFVSDVPREHRTKEARAREVVLLDREGNVLGRQSFDYTPHPKPYLTPGPGRYVPQTLPATSNVPPKPPLQRGSANGVSVVAGANGVVLFDTTGIDPQTGAAFGRGTSYSCFKLVREFGIFDEKRLGFAGRFQRHVAVRMFGLPRPFDGCELSGSYGHRWPDRYASHGPVEIALTEKGRTYFADRAAARDLALFVRSGKVQRIRRETGAALERGLGGYPIVRLTSADSSPPLGKIGWAPTPAGVTFVERSPTGRRFFVEVQDRKIRRQNLKPFAFVF